MLYGGRRELHGAGAVHGRLQRRAIEGGRVERVVSGCATGDGGGVARFGWAAWIKRVVKKVSFKMGTRESGSAVGP